MKILFVSLEFLPLVGGISSAGQSMVQAIAALGHELCLLLPRECAKGNPQAFCWLERPCGTFQHRRAHRRNAKSLLRVLEETRPDLVLFSDASARLVRYLDPRTLPPYLLYLYGTELVSPRPLASWLSGRDAAMKCAISYAHKVVCVSRYARQLLEAFLPGQESQIIYLPYEIAKTSPLPALRPSPYQGPGPHILSVCRLVARKNIAGSLRVVARMREEVPGLQFHIVGAGPERSALEALVSENDWESWVHFHGRIPLEDLGNYYGHADLFIMCSLPDDDGVEGLGLTYIEASVSGCLPVGSRHGGVAEVIQDGVTGLSIDPEKIEAAAQHILPYLKNAALRQDLQVRAAKIHREAFGFAAFQEAFGKALEAAAKG